MRINIFREAIRGILSKFNQTVANSIRNIKKILRKISGSLKKMIRVLVKDNARALVLSILSRFGRGPGIWTLPVLVSEFLYITNLEALTFGTQLRDNDYEQMIKGQFNNLRCFAVPCSCMFASRLRMCTRTSKILSQWDTIPKEIKKVKKWKKENS